MKQSYVFIMFMHIVRAFFLDCWSQGIPLLHSPQYIRQLISSPWTPLFFLSVWAGELFRQGCLALGTHRAWREGHSTTAFEARTKPLNQNGLRSSSKGLAQPLRCSTSPTWQILSLISSGGKLRHGTALRGHMLILWLSRERRQGLLPAGPVL